MHFSWNVRQKSFERQDSGFQLNWLWSEILSKPKVSNLQDLLTRFTLQSSIRTQLPPTLLNSHVQSPWLTLRGQPENDGMILRALSHLSPKSFRDMIPDEPGRNIHELGMRLFLQVLQRAVFILSATFNNHENWKSAVQFSWYNSAWWLNVP